MKTKENQAKEADSIAVQSKQTPTKKNSKSGQRMASGRSKMDIRYWSENVFRVQSGGGGLVPDYSIRIAYQGRRSRFPLHTPNKEAAADKARSIYAHLLANGWEETLRKFKPEIHKAKPTATVGEIIREAANLSSARRQSQDAYSKALRRIVAEIKGLDAGRKFDALKGGTEQWRSEIDAVQLSDITPAEVMAWKNKRLRDAGDDAIAKRRATITVNSLLRNAKALFARKVMPFLAERLTMPDTLPFNGVTMEKNPSQRYVSKIDAAKLFAKAKAELATSDPEAYKAMVLGLFCGLRRSEIDNLLWTAFDFQRCLLRVQVSEFHALKSEDSAGEIDLGEDFANFFREQHQKRGQSRFVISSANLPASEAKSRSYRCESIFKRVTDWLRANGVDELRPLHTMRKEVGSIIASKDGIFAASRFLRHSDIRITSAIYADKKQRIIPAIAF